MATDRVADQREITMTAATATSPPRAGTKLQTNQWIWLTHGNRYLCRVMDIGERVALLLMDDLATCASFKVEDLSASHAMYGHWGNAPKTHGYPNCFYGPYKRATAEEVAAYLDGELRACQRMRQMSDALALRLSEMKARIERS